MRTYIIIILTLSQTSTKHTCTVIAVDSELEAASHNIMYNILHTQTWGNSTNGTIITIRPFTLIIRSKYSEPVGPGLIKTP